MSQPHKHRDVIIAWANGEEIQFRYSSDSEWIDWPNQDIPPCFSEANEYRIKPRIVKSEGWVNVVGLNVASYIWPTKEEADQLAHKRIACIRIEWEEEV